MSARRVQGQAIFALLAILGVGVAILIYNFVSPSRDTIERERVTADALAQAKAALIGYAAGLDLTVGASRPGDLPCPDMDDDGTADTPCAGSTLGRLPWERLGLPDLRDGYGERLWYAVSSNFKNNPRTACGTPGLTTCLNSDTRGTITVRDRNGTVINNGNDAWSSHDPSGIIAVIIAPGRILTREGSATPQDRSCTPGTDCDANFRCTTAPASLTPKCNSSNYLDVRAGVEDNAGFTDSSATDGFINGDIFDAGGNLIVNDRVAVITYQDIMPLLEKRVAREAFNCVTGYASAAGSNGRYPWAASVSASGAGDYSSVQGERFGRLPDSFDQTLLGLNLPGLAGVVSFVCGLLPNTCMSSAWPSSPACLIATSSWWLNWKEHVFYGVADAYKPVVNVNLFTLTVSVPAPSACDGTAGNYDCLAVSPPTAATVDNKRFVVMVAGKRLAAVSGGQPRTGVNKQNSANYLEDENGNNTGTSNIYGQQSGTTTFNDVLLYFQ